MKRTCNWILAELYIKLVIRATLRQLYERLLVVSGNNNVFCSRRVVEPFLMIERRGRVFFPSGKIYTLTRYINFYVKWSEKNFVHRRKNNLKDKLVISLHNRVLICKISFSLIDSNELCNNGLFHVNIVWQSIDTENDSMIFLEEKFFRKIDRWNNATFRSNESLSSSWLWKRVLRKKKKKKNETKRKHIVNLPYFFSFVEISTCSLARTRWDYVIDDD